MKRTIRLSERDLHRVIKESVKRSITEAQKGIPYKHFKENQYEKAAKIEWMLADIRKKLEQLKGLYNDEFSDEFDRRIQDVNSFACEALNLMNEYCLSEGDFNSDDYYVGESKTGLHRIVKETVKRVLRENEADEFEYGDSEDLGKGRHRQTIIYNGKEVGFLLTIETNWLAPLQEKYVIPDIEYGMDIPQDNPKNNYMNVKNPFESDLQPVGQNGLIDGKRGWIDYKVFTDYEEALQYVKENFDLVAYLFEYGDYD